MLELRVFTVEEANSLLPELSELIVRLRAQQEEIAKKEVEIDTLELVIEENSESGYALLNQDIENLNRLISQFSSTVDEIHTHGCFLKDVDLGLIDFYSVVNGKVVYLCWRFGEEKIAHWHEIGEGYASRQPL